jgi:predicted acetyltransferase
VAYEIRALTTDDNAAAYRLGSLAFGYHGNPMPEGFAATADGRTSWGVFEDGALVAKAVDRVQGQWFGGRVVPASGVAGVAVIPEARRGGLARTVLTRLLREARDRGAAISTLFPTTPFPYRALGWEEVGALTYYGIPTVALAAGHDTVPSAAKLRPAMKDDLPAMEKLYREVAEASTGMMERSGPLFPAQDWIEDFDGVSVAVGPGGDVTGYASWDRGKGYDDGGKMTVYDVIAQDAASTAALRKMFAAWASVAPKTVLRVTPPDPILYGVASSSMDIERRQPWMLRLVDATAAVAARGWPAYQSGVVDLELTDAECEWNAGSYRLVIDGGDARLEPGGSGLVAFTPRGLATWFAGAATPAVLRRAGLMSGGDARSDAFLRSATAGPAPALHDYF